MGEQQYLDLLSRVLQAPERPDRTGVGTLSLFGVQMRFDISQSIPLTTTKKVSFKSIVEELLWICRGETDAKILQQKGVKIWDGNTSREFLDKQGLTHYREGVLGPGYGWQMRHQGALYFQEYAGIGNVLYGFDQLQYVLDLLKNDPFSRRIMISYWNPSDFSKTALLPCHVMVMFYVEEIDGQKYLSSHYIMRSNDLVCGFSFNLASYSVLTYILAMKTGMKPKEIIYTCNDAHIYKNHIPQVKEQLTRQPRGYPKLNVDKSVIDKDWNDISIDDFELIDYDPHPPIKAPMAV